MITKITDHVAAALARLPEESREQPNIVAFVSALVRPAQAVEDAFWQLLTETGISRALGVSLDRIGKIVGQVRDGRDDETYRAVLRARILANRSSGKIEELITIVRLVLGADVVVSIEREGTAALDVEARAIAITETLAQTVIDLLRTAKAAGVRLTFQYSTNINEDGAIQNFRFDSNPTGFGFDGGATGSVGFRSALS